MPSIEAIGNAGNGVSETDIRSKLNEVITAVNSGSAVPGAITIVGTLACAGDPNYPAATAAGEAYVVSSAGKVGGVSGKSVDVSDLIIATAANAGGTEAAVGTSWIVLEHNLVGALRAANNLSDLASAATARTNLGLGTAALAASGDFQPVDSDLTAIAALSTTAFGRSLLTPADAAAGRALLGVSGGALLGPPWTVPAHSDFTDFNLGTTVVTDNAFGVALNTPGQAFALRGCYKAAPGSTFTLYARLEDTWIQPVNNQRWGVLIGNSTTGRFSMYGWINNANDDRQAYISTWSNAFAFNAGAAYVHAVGAKLSAKWLKIVVGAATVTYFIGDGYNWLDTGLTETLATYLNNGGGSVDRIGIGFAGSAGVSLLFSVNSLSTTAPTAGGGGQL